MMIRAQFDNTDQGKHRPVLGLFWRIRLFRRDKPSANPDRTSRAEAKLRPSKTPPATRTFFPVMGKCTAGKYRRTRTEKLLENKQRQMSRDGRPLRLLGRTTPALWSSSTHSGATPTAETESFTVDDHGHELVEFPRYIENAARKAPVRTMTNHGGWLTWVFRTANLWKQRSVRLLTTNELPLSRKSNLRP